MSMFVRSSPVLVAPVIALTLTLAACGGGGGSSGGAAPGLPSSGPLAITATNYTAVAQETVGTTLYAGDTSRLVVGAEVAAEPPLLAAVLARVERWQRLPPAAGPFVPGVVTTETEACSGGGSATATFDDRNGNGDIDAGDSIDGRFANCTELGVVLNGRLVVRADAVSGDTGGVVFTASLTVTLEGFSVRAGTNTATGSGELRISQTSRALNNVDTVIDIPTLATSTQLAGVAVNRSATNLRLTLLRRPAGASWTDSLSVSGTISSSAVESRDVTVATVTPFVIAANATYPGSGQLTATGAGGSRVRVTAQNTTQVLIELDADGNGVYESSTTRPWSQLR